ncbi:MAG: efflux RND transporter permease subunit [Myxococcales bacterium]|nr:efflux RND transporter permease subunit [Myxococcales bacterium]
MNLASVAIARPVFTTMLAVGLLVLGFVGLAGLGTDLFPDVAFPVVAVNVPYPGASPDEVETLVTQPVEDAVIGLNDIDRVRSFTREGLSTTLVIFKLGVDISDAATQVRERVAGVRARLPREVLEPSITRFDVSAAPILTYTLASRRSLSEARNYADDVLKPALEQVQGVALVDVKGGTKREIRVALNRHRLDALRLDAPAIVLRLRAANLNVPAGRYDEGTREVSVRTVGAFANVEAIRELIVAAAPDGSAVRLRDVATIDDGFEDRLTIVRSNGADTVSFEVKKQSGQNTVEVADAVNAKLAELEKSLPPELSVTRIIDQSRIVKENLHEVQVSIVFGGAMAILIILIFMLDLRSTLISAVALPTSVIGTFFFMYVLGYTLNMMTLLGLSLAIGLLIDDAVVVRENIFKHLEMGKEPARAALDGTQEIALSVLATTLTIVAVFLPVAFVKGMVGQFFRQFGITISVAVTLSMLVAFTLDPMLSSRFATNLEGHGIDRFEPIKRPFRRFFAGLDAGYEALLRWAVGHRKSVLALAGASLAMMVVFAKLAGSDFVNAEDRGQFLVELELPAGTALAETALQSRAVEEAIRAHPEVKSVFATIGPSGDSSRAIYRVVTSRKSERTVPLEAIKDAARKAATLIPNVKVSVADPPFIEGAAAEAPIMIGVRGKSYDEVVPMAEQLENILRTTPGVTDVRMKYSPGRPELEVAPDRHKLAELGVPVAAVAMALRTAVEGEEAGRLRLGDDEIPIKVRLASEERGSEQALAALTLATPRGPVKLSDVASFSRADGPQVIEREGRARQIQIWAAPKGRPLGDIVAEITPRIDAIPRPSGAGVFYDGQIRMMGETNQNMGLALLLGVAFIYIVLASQFESFIHPLTIMVTLPLALVGAITGLFLSGNSLAMGAIIGIILLMGLVTKNAILLVDRALVRVRDRGESPLDAVLAAGPERLRPILMTSAAMVLGMLPTALGQGEGSEFRAPMAIAVIGGVVSSTLLSLLVVPVVYLAVESLKATIARRLDAYAATPALHGGP